MKTNIAIIGGGLSGLTLAYLLEKQGYKITILEASSRIGGRIHTVEGKLGTHLELGATWFSDIHVKLVLLLKELGLKKYPQYTKGTTIFQTKSFEPPQLFTIPDSEQPSFRIAGGTYSLIDALKNNLKRTNIFLNTRATRISLLDDENILVEADELSLNCEKVIVCIPPQLVSSIQLPVQIPSELNMLLPTVQTWMAGSIKFVLEYESPFWRKNNFSGMLYSHADIITEMYDHTNYEVNKFGFTGFLNSSTNGISLEKRMSNVLRHLSEFWGEEVFAPSAYFDKVWNDDLIVFNNQIIKMPHQNNGHPLLQKAYLEEKLYFCGTETSSQYAGYMEGAIQAAMRVANRIKQAP